MELLDWLYTKEGKVYMTFWECSLNDLFLVVTTGVLCSLIIGAYFYVAYYFHKLGKGYEKSATKAMIASFMNVFVFCALTGYGYIIISIWINAYWLRVLLLIALLYQSVRLVRSLMLNTSIQEVYQYEKELAEKYEKELNQRTVLLDLFTSTASSRSTGIKLIPFDELDAIPFNQKFNSDSSGVIENERFAQDQPGFSSRSTMEANSYVDPHAHDTIKILTCLEGAFFDSHTNRWYKPGEYLIIQPYDPLRPQKNWHDIKTGEEKTKLLTFIFPKR